jgi:hypothetical protein
MKNNKIDIELDMEDLLGLLPYKKGTLEYDLDFIIENGMNKYYDEHQEHKKKKKEFVALFKECYSDIVKIMEFDPHKRVPVNCYTCIKGMDLSKQYGKPKVSK